MPTVLLLPLLGAAAATPEPATLRSLPPPVDRRTTEPTEEHIAQVLAATGEEGLSTLPRRDGRATHADSSHQVWRDKVYRGANAFDGDFRTAWVEGRPRDGLGEWIEAHFEAPVPAEPYGLLLVPGFAKNSFMFQRNNRPRRVLVQLSCPEQPQEMLRYRLAVADARRPQLFPFPTAQRWPMRGTCSLRLTLEQVYRGTHYRDTSIAEVRLVVIRRPRPPPEGPVP